MAFTAKYAIVIETDTWMGNGLNDNICAHLTGTIGDERFGEEYVDEDIAEQFLKIIGNEQYDGYWAPSVIGQYVEDFSENDCVIFFDSKPTKKHLKIIKERVDTLEFDDQAIGVFGISLFDFKTKESISI